MKSFIFSRLLLTAVIYTAANLIMCLILPQSFSLLLCTGAGAALAIPFLWLLFSRNQVFLKAPPVSCRIQLLTTPVVVLLALSSCLAFNDLIIFLPAANLFAAYEDSIRTVLYAPSLAEQIFCTALLIPAAEELIFRGQAFLLIRALGSFRAAAVLSSLLFALYHGNAVQGIYAFFMGLIAAWLMEKFGNILFPYLFHASANLCSIMMTRFWPRQWQEELPLPLLAEAVLALAFTAFCIHRIHGCLRGRGGNFSVDIK